MSVTRYNFRKPKINRQEHESINKIFTHPFFNALINPQALDVLTELLELCKIDTASTFDEAKGLLERHDYDIVVLDIMGVKGFELLGIANKRGIPALMLTAHALTEESLKKSAEDGAAYYAPKDEINQIATFVADVIEAKEKNKRVANKRRVL